MSEEQPGPGEYRCSECGEIFAFNPEWTDDDAQAEREQLWPHIPPEFCAIVCDDCHQAVLKRAGRNTGDAMPKEK